METVKETIFTKAWLSLEEAKEMCSRLGSGFAVIQRHNKPWWNLCHYHNGKQLAQSGVAKIVFQTC